MSFVSAVSVVNTQDAELRIHKWLLLAAAACMEYKPPQPHCHITAATRETPGSTVLRTTGKRCSMLHFY